MRLDIEPYDPNTDSIVIEGIRYSGDLFRDLGIHGVAAGSLLRVLRRKDGLVYLQVVIPGNSDSVER